MEGDGRGGRVRLKRLTELAKPVFAPALHGAVLQARAGVATPSGELDGVCDSSNRDRDGAVKHFFRAAPALAVTELSIDVEPSAGHGASGAQRARVIAAGNNRHGVAEPGDGGEGFFGLARAVAELSEVIEVAPAAHAPVALESAIRGAARGDHDDLGEPGDLDHFQAISILPAAGCSILEPGAISRAGRDSFGAVGVLDARGLETKRDSIAPAGHVSLARASARVVSRDRELDDAAQMGDEGGDGVPVF